jgi:ABC-type sugar transport system ATPase subunit
MISSELPELLGLSDRIGVMAEGRLVTVLGKEEADPETVMKFASMQQPH